MSSLAVLDRALYSVTEGARLLEIQPSKLRRWLEGAAVGGTVYPPVIRPVSTGSGDVTWAEFVEAGFLREYRGKGISLQRLRPFIDAMREAYGVPYPLAHFKPSVDPRRKELMVELWRLQDDVGLEEELALVHMRSGQLVWAEPVLAFLNKVEFDPQGVSRRLHPLGKQSPVTIDPDVAFGVPQVGGIRTEILAELVAAGESLDGVASSYRLTSDDVMAAVRWELRLGRKAA